MAEPPTKIPKVEPDHQIFWDFRESTEVLKRLEEALFSIRNGYSEMCVKLLKINVASARASESFTKATCTSDAYRDVDYPYSVESYSFGSLFSNGTATLRKYLEDYEVPRDTAPRKALRKLLHFLHSSLTSLKQPEKNVNEGKWAVQLSQHLFSKLADSRQYTIDKHYRNKAEVSENTCPCGEGDKLSGEFGDTSFGCGDAWHGSVDIFLEDVIVHLVLEDNVKADEDSDGTLDCLHYGYESSVNNSLDSSDQLLAQCVVFSFLQRKHNEAGFDNNNFLVPSFGVSKSAIVISFYDSKNDVLLQSAKLDLFLNDILNIKMVVCVWMAINYKYFCTGITEDMKRCKSNFHDLVGDYLEKYEQEVKRPVVKLSHQSSSTENWAKDISKIGENPVTLLFEPLNPENQ